MRYVIGVCLLTGFIVWDAVENNGRFLDMSVRQLRYVLNMFGAQV